MVRLLLTRLRRRPAAPLALIGPAIERREQAQARARLLALARQRQAGHRYEGPGR